MGLKHRLYPHQNGHFVTRGGVVTAIVEHWTPGQPEEYKNVVAIMPWCKLLDGEREFYMREWVQSA